SALSNVVTFCPGDRDCDQVSDGSDNCPDTPNPGQTNTDGHNSSLGRGGQDTVGDACDENVSGDGYSNEQHAALGKDPAAYCPIMRADVNGDGVVDALDLSI